MLLTVFSFLYELICRSNLDSPEYEAVIYDNAGLLTLLSSALFALIFFLLLGRWKPVFHQPGHWIITLVLCAITGFLIAFLSAKSQLGTVDSYLIRFAVINMILTALLFFVFSLIFKQASIFAKRTPF